MFKTYEYQLWAGIAGVSEGLGQVWRDVDGVYVCLQVDSVDIWIQDPRQQRGTASATSGLTVWLILEEFAHFFFGWGEHGWFLYQRTCSSSIIIKQRKANEKPVAYWIQLFTM